MTIRCSLWCSMVMVLLMAHSVISQIQCNDAVSYLLPCEAYLLGDETNPSIACCSGVKSLGEVAMASQEDRRAICRCFKDTAMSLPINAAKAEHLPQLCKVNVGMDVNPDVNCDSL